LALAGANSISALTRLSGAARVGAGIALMIGAASLVLSLVVALRGSLQAGFEGEASVDEITNFATERFTTEPDLWRVHVRTIRSTRKAIEGLIMRGTRWLRPSKTPNSFF
jgi:ABC-type dipeptide/oligopeptide/nickel transport system permease subunit